MNQDKWTEEKAGRLVYKPDNRYYIEHVISEKPYRKETWTPYRDGEPMDTWYPQLADAKARAQRAINHDRREAEIAAGIAVEYPIDDLLPKLIRVAGSPVDSRFTSWVKRIDRVNPEHDDGYMYEGEFVSDGTVRTTDRDAVYLVMTCAGSRKYNTRYYTLIRLTDGVLFRTTHATTGDKPGWALRLMAAVQDMLK